MAVDANLGNKSNSSIIRQITYDADLQADGSVNGRATVSYDYSARVAANDPGVNPRTKRTRRLQQPAPIFVPPGSTLTQDDQCVGTSPTVVNNDDNTEFVSRLFVPFDSTQRFQFDYHDPANRRKSRIVQALSPADPEAARHAGERRQRAGHPAAGNVDGQHVTRRPPRPICWTAQSSNSSFDLTVDHWIEIVYASAAVFRLKDRKQRGRVRPYLVLFRQRLARKP